MCGKTNTEMSTVVISGGKIIGLLVCLLLILLPENSNFIALSLCYYP